jgi:hypothetical protein
MAQLLIRALLSEIYLVGGSLKLGHALTEFCDFVRWFWSFVGDSVKEVSETEVK